MKLLIVHNQVLLCDLLVQLCTRAFPHARVEKSLSDQQAVALCTAFAPNIVLLSLGEASEAGRLTAIARAAPRAKIIVLSPRPRDYLLHCCLQARVHGFVDISHEMSTAIPDAITAVRDTGRYFAPSFGLRKASLRKDPLAFSKVLTDREQELLCLLGEGLSNEEVAARIGVMASTVKVGGEPLSIR